MRWLLSMVNVALLGATLVSCADAGPKRRKRSPSHEAQCKEPSRPRAFFYPSDDGRTFAPDDPHVDGCALLVPDYLFCCPDPAP